MGFSACRYSAGKTSGEVITETIQYLAESDVAKLRVKLHVIFFRRFFYSREINRS